MQSLKLGDLTSSTITKGTTPTTNGGSFVDRGVNFVKVQAVDVDGHIVADQLAHIDEETHNKLARSKLRENDILFSIAGAIGRTAIVSADVLPANTNQALAIVRADPEKIDYRYLYYVLRSDTFLHYSLGRVVQTAQANVSLSVLKDAPILVPERNVQEAIASVLGAFDDLLENNRRRIEILEEMARLLYREWFVHFRFPGHEEIEMVDSELGSIPEGWEVVPFSETSDFVNGFAFKSKDHWHDEGLPIIKIKELKAGVSVDTPRYHGEDIKPKYFVEDGDVLFSWSAHLDAYFWSGGRSLLNQHLFVVRPHKLPKLFMFHSLRGRMHEFRARSQGTTMQHIKRSALSEVSLVVPTDHVLDEFISTVAPITALSLNLTQQNRVLREARDLLLPRLVSGELDVSELNLDEVLA